jgi:hypothetical protein
VRKEVKIQLYSCDRGTTSEYKNYFKIKYKGAHKAVKRSPRADRRCFLKKKAAKAEAIASKGCNQDSLLYKKREEILINLLQRLRINWDDC